MNPLERVRAKFNETSLTAGIGSLRADFCLCLTGNWYCDSRITAAECDISNLKHFSFSLIMI